MTRNAICPRCGSMLEYRDTGYLAPHWGSINDVVAIVTAYTPSVIAMAKESFKVIFRLQRTIIRGESVADVARPDLAFRRVTGVTGGVRVDARRDRLAWA